MKETNFELAPAATLVDGQVAAPIDIQTIDAALRFDAGNESATGEATLRFTMGPQDGCPVFDLRQRITEAWLDGEEIATELLRHRDLGGGPGAEMRMIERTLAAGSRHELRLRYVLSQPEASKAGTYQPGIIWGSGPRVDFNFGFTDLGAGRYLEAWIPANLIFDQFRLTLEIEVCGTDVPHILVTNGRSEPMGANRWRVAFPDRFTALSPLVQLHAREGLRSYTATLTLPVSGEEVTIEAWQFAESEVALPEQVERIRGFLCANEMAIGAYLHGARFVAFLHIGGMEYDGGATSDAGALDHETFHSWWARGVKPRAQCDGWFDEAWTVYHDRGGADTLAFDFSEPPVTLCNRNLWSRATPILSYSAGYRFWCGIADLVGAGPLQAAFAEFYRLHAGELIRTEQIEEWLVSRLGDRRIVDGFHRFVYGLPDPAEPLRLEVRKCGLAGGRVVAEVYNAGTSTARHFVIAFESGAAKAAVCGFDLAAGESATVSAVAPAEFGKKIERASVLARLTWAEPVS